MQFLHAIVLFFKIVWKNTCHIYLCHIFSISFEKITFFMQRFWLEKSNCGFFTCFTNEKKTPQNNISSQNFSPWFQCRTRKTKQKYIQRSKSKKIYLEIIKIKDFGHIYIFISISRFPHLSLLRNSYKTVMKKFMLFFPVSQWKRCSTLTKCKM